jgi:hypothetical protein
MLRDQRRAAAGRPWPSSLYNFEEKIMEREMEPQLATDVDAHYEIASDILQARDGLQPMALLRVGIKWNIVPMSFEDDQAKDRAMHGLKCAAAAIGADVCVMLNEAWVVLVPKDTENALDIVPSQHPHRQEILNMTVQVKGVPGAWLSRTPIIRSGEKVVLSSRPPEFEYFEGAVGRMLEVFN